VLCALVAGIREAYLYLPICPVSSLDSVVELGRARSRRKTGKDQPVKNPLVEDKASGVEQQ